MNDNKTFSTTTTINEEYMLFPYNDHYSSQPLLPFSPCSSINDILIHSNTSNNHLDHHHHQYLQAPASPFSHFESVPDFALLASFLPQKNGHNDNQTITTNDHHHPPSFLPFNNPFGESHLIEPSETKTTHIEDSQRISTSQDPNMKKVKKPSRTDRHSKIKTVKGTRDRRMRLSLDVARELFGLQDMLGFDKASKTVEWLLTQAKPKIIKIANSLSNKFNHGRFSSCSVLGSVPVRFGYFGYKNIGTVRIFEDIGPVPVSGISVRFRFGSSVPVILPRPRLKYVSKVVPYVSGSNGEFLGLPANLVDFVFLYFYRFIFARFRWRSEP